MPPSTHAHERPVSRGMRALLYALTALTFIAGTQLVVLGEHTTTLWAWAIATPASAAFIGAGFWSASTVVFWCARQRDWSRGRVIVPTVAVVATMLLVATLQNMEVFRGLFGLAWVEIYAFFPPLLAAITVQQLAAPGRVTRGGDRLPPGLRATLAMQAVVAIAAGTFLFAAPGAADDAWSWSLTDLTSKAIGTWLVGMGVTSGVVALLDDRSAMPGWALAQLVLGGAALFGMVRFAGDIDPANATTWLLAAYLLSALATGAAGAALAWREGRFAPTSDLGGIPIEVRTPTVQLVPVPQSSTVRAPRTQMTSVAPRR